MVQTGLSPRVRGNLHSVPPRTADGGSIPARAGEPVILLVPLPPERVYPRACGGTISVPSWNRRNQGLSPRVRGNRCGHPPNGRHAGSIPARAGEPLRIEDIQLHLGSIPARAGEPSFQRRPPSPPRVYPRACGGTLPSWIAAARTLGLSPRVRGNRQAAEASGCHARSIPARAGEPTWRTWPASTCRVYPRACGGTGGLVQVTTTDKGLSPRVRGNRGARVSGPR